MQGNTNAQKSLKNIMSVAPKHCDNCGNRYYDDDFKVIKSSPVNTVIHLKCRSCNNAYMLNVLNPMNGIVGAQRTPINIDLVDSIEIQKFAGGDAVDRDESLDIQEDLQSHLTQADLKKVFEL